MTPRNRAQIAVAGRPMGVGWLVILSAHLAACASQNTPPSDPGTVGSSVTTAVMPSDTTETVASAPVPGGPPAGAPNAVTPAGTDGLDTAIGASEPGADTDTMGVGEPGELDADMMGAGEPGGLDADMMEAAGAGGLDTDMMEAASGGNDSLPQTPGDVCALWKAGRADLTESTWNGDVASCDAGEMSEEALNNALRLFNMYRTMAGLSTFEMSEENNRLAQECALLMRGNGRITHTPPASAPCYTEEAARTAGSSSLSSGPAVGSVGGYMIDPGNPTTLGHRRWILSNLLAGIGFGSAGSASCQYQPANWRPSGGEPWVAWPPPGQMPIQAFGSRWSSIDSTGWSIQSDSIDLRDAQVSVTSGGMDLAVSVTVLARGYGSTYAQGFIPMGWTAAAGQTYSVKVSGAPMPIEYEVEVVDCQ